MIRILSCGRIKDKWLSAGIAEYVKRIGPYEKIEVLEVADEKAPAANSEAENEKVKQIEGQRLLKLVKDSDYVILLDLWGKEMDSVAFSKKIEKIHTDGYSSIDFIIGGSLGVSKELVARSDLRWKLSVNTFPHQLCRLLVVEQIYRAFRIQHNEPYHK